MKQSTILPILLLALMSTICHAQEATTGPDWKTVYAQPVDDRQVGPLPDDFFILKGDFAIVEFEDGKGIQAPGNPVGEWSFMAGPDARGPFQVSADFKAQSRGRLFPAFAVGIGGNRGLKALMYPALGELQLFSEGEIIARAPLRWRSGSMGKLTIELTIENGRDMYAAAAWSDPQNEIYSVIRPVRIERFPRGKATYWALPYSGKPILIDNLLVAAAPVE